MHAGQSLGPGGRRLKAVDNRTNDIFDDDDDGQPRRRKKEDDGEGDMDEMLFEEEFADDDEMEPVDNDDEEAKEAEVDRYICYVMSICLTHSNFRNDSRGNIRAPTNNGKAMWMSLTRRRKRK